MAAGRRLRVRLPAAPAAGARLQLHALRAALRAAAQASVRDAPETASTPATAPTSATGAALVLPAPATTTRRPSPASRPPTSRGWASTASTSRTSTTAGTFFGRRGLQSLALRHLDRVSKGRPRRRGSATCSTSGRWRLSSNVSRNQDAQRATLRPARLSRATSSSGGSSSPPSCRATCARSSSIAGRRARTGFPAADGGTRVYDSQTQDLDGDLIHQLYESLESAPTPFRYGDADLARPASRASTSHELNFNYTRRSRAAAGCIANLGRLADRLREHGPASTWSSEGHPAIAGPRLVRAGAGRTSTAPTVRVFLRSPVSPIELIAARRGGALHPDAGRAPASRSWCFALPPQFVVPGTYEFRVSYVLDDGGFELTHRHAEPQRQRGALRRAADALLQLQRAALAR